MNNLNEINIGYRTCYYFGGMIRTEDFDFDNILLDQKPNEYVLVYNISNKTLISAKLLHSRFDKRDRFISVYDRTRYLVLFGPEKYNVIHNRIEYLIN